MAEYLGALAVDWALKAFLIDSALEAAFVYYGTQAAVYAVAIGYSQNQASIARRRSREAFNSSQVDRLVNVNSAESPRELVLGRVRKGGQIFFRGSTGVNNTKFVVCIALAGHEIDAVESFYLNDMPVTLDGSGYVQEDPYVKRNTISDSIAFSDVATTVTIPGTFVAGSVSVNFSQYSGEAGQEVGYSVAPVSVVGNVVTLDSHFIAGVVSYQITTSSSAVKLRYYLGAPGQTADATLISLFPSLWTSDHTVSGIPYVIAEFDYNEDAFPSGMPAITAKVRGAKIYDPGGSVTQWTENPALMQRHVLLHPQFGKRTSITAEEDARFIQAAAECAASQTWSVNGGSVTAPLYRAALVALYGTSARDVLDDLATAMAGRWAHAQGQFFVRAGVFHASVKTIGDNDLATVTRTQEGQESSSSISISVHKERASKFNVAQIRIWDAAQNFKEVPLTPLKPVALIARDGSEIAQEFRLAAVPYAYQALHIAGVSMRDARDPLTVTVTCKLSVYHIELFDTIAVTLARFGWTAKLFEVISRKLSMQGTIQLVLKETTASNYDKDADFVPGGFASNTALTSPFAISPPGTLTAASGTNELEKLHDGTILTRVRVSWPTITNLAVTQGGWVDVSYLVAGGQESSWVQQTVSGDSASVLLRSVKDTTSLLIRARCRSAIATSAWGLQIAHNVVGKTEAPTTPSSFRGAIANGAIRWDWVPIGDADYSDTEIRSSDANWGLRSPAPLFKGMANSFNELPTAAGSLTRYIRHFDTSGNASPTVSTSVSVAGTDLLATAAASAVWTGVSSRPANLAALSGAENLGANLLNASNWVIGSSGDQTTGGGTQWSALQNSDGCTNQINLAAGPDGSMRPVWYAISGTATSGNPEGGIISTNSIAIDNTKPYRFSCWIYLTGVTDGNIFLGIGTNQVDDIPSGTINANPYFHAGPRSLLTVNHWYLFTGHVLPASYSGAQLNFSGIYDGTTGQKVQPGTDFRWHAGITACTLRTFQYYTGGMNRYALFTGPRFDQLDGSEPSIAALLADAVLSRANTAFTNAGAAQTAADAANTILTDIANDDVITASEKPAYVREYGVLTSEQAGIDAQATATGFATSCASAKTAYDTAVSNLTGYVTGHNTPSAWNSLTGSTYVTGSTVTAYFLAVYSTRQTLLNQIAATAATLASWTGVSSKPADTDLLNTHTQGGILVVNHPAGGNYSSNASNVQGALKIRLPRGFTNAMIRFFVEIYEYSSDRSATFEVGGYTSSGGNTWINTYAKMTGSAASQKTVRFGFDGTYACVWIGEDSTTTVWQIPQVVISNLRVGYRDNIVSSWAAGWDLSFDQTAHSGHNLTGTTETSPLTGASWSQIPTGTGRPVDNATSDLSAVLKLSSGATAALTGNSAARTGSANNYLAKVSSTTGYTGGCFVSGVFTASSGYLMLGLTLDTNAGYSYANDRFHIECASNGLVAVYESGSGPLYNSGAGFAVTGDVLSIAYDGVNARYAKNGVVFRTVAAVVTAPLYMDNYLYSSNSVITAMRFGPMTNNDWSAIGGTGRPSDNATSDLSLYNSAGAAQTITGNSITGNSSDFSAVTASRNAHAAAAYCSWMPDTNAYYIAGLNGSPTGSISGAAYSLISRGDGKVSSREGGTETLLTTYIPGDVLAVEYDGVSVRYLKNGTVLNTIIAAANQVLFFVAGLVAPTSKINGIRFGPLTNLAGVTGQAAAAALTANWVTVTGAGRPADNATVGADWISGNLTNKPADSALLNSLQEWSQVQNASGTRPANNATVGATFGMNISGQAGTSDIAAGAVTASGASAPYSNFATPPNSAALFDNGIVTLITFTVLANTVVFFRVNYNLRASSNNLFTYAEFNATLLIDGVASSYNGENTAAGYRPGSFSEASESGSLEIRVTGLSAGSHTFQFRSTFQLFDATNTLVSWGSAGASAVTRCQAVVIEQKV